MHQRRSRLDIGKNCLTERFVKHWDRLLVEGQVGQSPIPGVISKMYRRDDWEHGSVVDVAVLGLTIGLDFKHVFLMKQFCFHI